MKVWPGGGSFQLSGFQVLVSEQLRLNQMADFTLGTRLDGEVCLSDVRRLEAAGAGRGCGCIRGLNGLKRFKV